MQAPASGAGKGLPPRDGGGPLTAFFTAPSLAWGPGAVEQLSGLGARRAAVVVDPAVAGREGPLRAVEELEKAGATTELIGELRHPQRVANVGELAERLRRFGPDWIVAIGGGATLDAAKAARLWLEQPELPLDPPPSVVPFPEVPTSHLVAIPTTSGSGAEASWTCDLLAGNGSPVELAHRALVPDWALLDPAFAQGLPPAELRSGGLATAAVAAEAYVSAWSNPFSDALAVGALTAVARNLSPALKWTDEPEARAALYYAATMAGLAASNAQRGVAHALARALEGPSGVAYGTLLGLVVPTVLDFDRPAAREKLEALSWALATPEEPSHPDLPSRLRRLATSVGAPRDLAQAGAPIAELRSRRAELLAAAMRSPGTVANPRVPTAEDLAGLLDQLLGSTPASGGSRLPASR